jgi:hypothetical protein
MTKRKRARSLDLSETSDPSFEWSLAKRHLDILIESEKNRHALLLKRLEGLRDQVEQRVTPTAQSGQLETAMVDRKSRFRAAAHAMVLSVVGKLVRDAFSQEKIGWKGVVRGVNLDTVLQSYKHA